MHLDQTPISPQDEVDRRGHKPRTRQCIVTRQLQDPKRLIRLAQSPDGVLVVDIAGSLPGRGVWVTPERDVFKQALKSGAFARGFKSQISIPDDLIDQIISLLKQRILGLVGMAHKAGDLHLGFDQTYAAARHTPLAWRIEARDGSEDGRGKIRTASKAMSYEMKLASAHVIGCFKGAVLGAQLGRDFIVHAALKQGKLSDKLAEYAHKLDGFIPLIPDEWPDREHEKNSSFLPCRETESII